MNPLVFKLCFPQIEKMLLREKRVQTQSDFNNGRSTVPVLPDTGVVLPISTGTSTMPVLDDKPVLSCQHWLSTACQYQLHSIEMVLSSSTGAVLSSHYWCSTAFFVKVATIRVGPTGKFRK